jgi:putative nucleotidyltransferase with HDIG domain
VSEERAAGLTRIEKEVRQQPVIGTGEGELGESLDQDTMALMGSMFSLLQVIPDHHRVGRDIAQQVAAALRCSEVLLFVLNEAEGHLSLLASAHAVDHTPSQAGASTELESWFSELRSNHRFFPSRAVEPFIIEPQHANGATLVRLPMVAFGQVSGVLEANCNCGQPPLSRRERTVLSALGVIGATALKNCDLYERLESRWMGLIAALCRTIHSYDAYKLDHAERVSRFAVEIARVMGQCDADELQLIRVAGLVHDIGKVGLPPRLFEKRGRLRTSERKLLQQHCHIGADLLDSIPQMEQLAEIVRRHHEHYDGGGYPDGLAGHEIPIESRIIAVADAYDAMTSRRPFRPAFSHDEAVRRIRAASGTQFDPAVATVFVELFGGDMGRALLLNADGLGHLDLVMRSAILAGSAPMAP